MMLEGPLIIGWDVTNKCNLKCIHCYADAGKQLEDELSTKEIKNTIKEAKDIGTVLISFSGGEPLLRKDIFELIDYAKKLDITVFLNTNGTLINSAIAKKLKKHKVDGVEISIDGLNAETHEKIRCVKGSFEKSVIGLKECLKEKVPAGVMTLATSLNYTEIPDLVDFVYSLGSIGIGILRFKPVGRGEGLKELELTPEQRKKVLFEVFRKRVEYEKTQKKRRFMIKAETPVSIIAAMEFPSLIEKNPYVNIMTRGCPGGVVSCNIRPNGDVASCPQMPLTVGNIKDNDLKDIWNHSVMFRKLRDKRNIKGKCGSCKHLNICGGCRTCAYLHKMDYLGEDPGCWL